MYPPDTGYPVSGVFSCDIVMSKPMVGKMRKCPSIADKEPLVKTNKRKG